MKRNKIYLVIFTFLSLSLFFLYLFFINLSTDTITIFIAPKIFLGHWLSKGIFPFFNPHFFAGVPFAFDLGLGNFHPFNLFFLASYPLSFALWVGFSSALFLIGFYLMFKNISKNKNLSFILTLILFFSGSGFWRLNNPTIFLVIAHYGLYICSLSRLKFKGWRNYFFPLFIGILMTLSGHIQFVIYGYILGLIYLFFIEKLAIKRIITYYSLLIIFTSWYYLLSFPLVLTSTRITSSSGYVGLDTLKPFQLFQLLLPFVFGEMRSGASWNIGPWPGIGISIISLLIVGYLFFKKNHKLLFFILLFFLIMSFGFINIPFLRAARQIFILIHILILVIIALNGQIINQLVNWILKNRKQIIISLILIILGIIFFYSGYFPKLFLVAYKLIKHRSPGIFFDSLTILAISNLIGKSFIVWMLLLITLLVINKKNTVLALTIFIIFEGIFVNFSTNYFIPAKILTAQNSLSKIINTKDYRIQSVSEVIPFFGFYNYVTDFYLRPPFSKEKPIFDNQESKSLTKLKEIFSFIPSSWSLVVDAKSVQGHNTFVPKKISSFFKNPSTDFEKEYEKIIKRNPYFKSDAEGSLNINALEMRNITLYDPRWQELAVRYFISNQKLKNYNLILEKNGKYIYENKKSPAIYSLKSIYQDPNGYVFKINRENIGKKLELIINPDGFVVEYNGRKINPKIQDFKITIDLIETGTLKIFYSPLFHLKEFITMF